MGSFSYTVQNERGEMSTGVCEAADENEAVSLLQGRGFFILALSSEKGAAKSSRKKRIAPGRVGGREMVFFAEQAATLLHGGVPLVRAISLLAEHTQNKALKSALSDVAQDVSAGSALYKALQKHPNAFEPLWVYLVEAGEMGGQLPKILTQISQYLEAAADLKSRIVTALAYPAVLATMSVGVLAFFVIKIVPVFAKIFKDFNIRLPMLTQTIITVSTGIADHLFLFVFLGTAGYLSWSAFTATDEGKHTKWRLIFRAPFFGAFVKNILIERLLSTLSTLVQSGVSILSAIDVLEGLFSTNIIFLNMLKQAKDDVTGGKSISAAFRRSGVLPSLVVEMMFMGEESGKLPEMLTTLNQFYRQQIDQFIRRFSSVIDPILVVGVGGIVGVIVLAVFLPIFKLSTMGGG